MQTVLVRTKGEQTKARRAQVFGAAGKVLVVHVVIVHGALELRQRRLQPHPRLRLPQLRLQLTVFARMEHLPHEVIMSEHRLLQGGRLFGGKYFKPPFKL